MVRRAISAMATDCGMDAEALADVRLAVTEAATNAVVHAYHSGEGDLNVTAGLRDGELSVVIADTGPGVGAVDRESAGAGLGLPLIASLASRLNVRTRPSGTEVHMAFPCPRAA